MIGFRDNKSVTNCIYRIEVNLMFYRVKQTLTFFFLFFLVSNNCLSQPSIAWQKCLGGTMGDNAFSMCETRDGNYIIAGISTSDDGDVIGPNLGGFDIWVLMMDTSGNILWQKNYGGVNYDNARSIIQTSDGGFIMAGATRSGNIPGRIGSSGYDFYVVRIDSIGNLLWHKCYGGTSDDEASDIKETLSGDFYVLGYTASSDSDVSVNYGSADYWLIKIDSAGTLLSEHSYGGTSYDKGQNIILDSNGAIQLVGYSSSNDVDVIGNHGGQDYWLVNVDSSENILSNYSYGGSGDDYANSVKQEGNNLVIAGWSYSSDGDVLGHHGQSVVPDIWIIKIDSLNNLVWNRSYGSSNVDAQPILQIDDLGNYFLFGVSDGYDGDVSYNNGGSDYWLSYLDSSGNIIWERNAGGSGFDFFYYGILSSTGKIIMCGNSDSPNNGDVSGYHGGVGGDIWLVAFNDIYTFVNENSLDLDIKVYPNPFNDKLLCKLNLPGVSFTVNVFDVSGRIVYSSSEMGENFEVDLAFLSSGFYEVNICNSKVNKTYKVIKQN